MIILKLSNRSPDNVMTAMEAKEIANLMAINWHTDAVLTSIGSIGDKDDNGGSLEWCFYYVSPLTVLIENNVTKYDTAYIYVFNNQSSFMETAFRFGTGFFKSINNFYFTIFHIFFYFSLQFLQ